MRKYFYNVYFHYEREETSNSFNIGYFSSKEIAVKVVSDLKNAPGFCEYPLECFNIEKRGVEFETDIDKSNCTIFVLTHEYTLDNVVDIVTEFGLYRSEQLAQVELEKQVKRNPYKNHKEGFSIACWKVDRDIQWKEGFTST